MISVVIPLFNNQDSITSTIKSVLAQTFGDYEVIVVNDGSTDGSAEKLSQFQNPRLQVINKANGGVSSARNAGIAAARGEYIALLDADDEWAPDYLDHMATLAQQYPDCDVVACRYQMRYADGSVHPITLNKLNLAQGRGIMDNYFEVASCSHPPIWTSSVMVRKQAIASIGCFPEGITSGEDLLTWARLACRYKIAYDSTYCGAVFYVEGYSVNKLPKRIPAEIDTVGNELQKLNNLYTPYCIKQYISLWHKMRSSVYFRLGMKKKSISEAIKGIKYNPYNYKLYIYIIINILPFRISKQ